MAQVEQRVSVVVCAYTLDRWPQLCAAIDSLHAQQRVPAEIIVAVDFNHALLERVRAELPAVKAIANRFARGLSGARNTGVAAATGAIIAFMDDDAVAAPDWLARLLPHFEDRRVAGAGGRIDPLWLTGQPGWFPDEFGWVVGCSYRGLPRRAGPVRNLIGCNMAFRRDVFERVGGFRTEIGRTAALPMGCEETELCIRVWQQCAGERLIYEPAAVVSQWVPRQRARLRYFTARCYAEGRSKALVTQTVGSAAALASERGYATRTLPLGVLRNVGSALQRRDAAGFARAGAITAGLAITTTGYLHGRTLGRTDAGHVVGPRAFRLLREARRERLRLRGEAP